MIILNILGLCLWLLVVPFLIGLIPTSYLKTSLKRPSVVLILGYISTFAILEIVGIPIVLLINYNGYTVFLVVLSVVFIVASIWGVLRLKSDSILKNSISGSIKRFVDLFRSNSLEARIYTILIVLAVGCQFFMAIRLASMDADDFYFNAQAMSAQIFKTMYRIDADTGRNTVIDIRHCLALMPMWQAFLSTMSGVHVAILVHKILPFVLIPLSYYLVNEIGILLFEGSESAVEKRLLFVFLINIWRIFGFASYYTTETFFLLRTWQGKSIAGNLILPSIIWVFLLMYRNHEDAQTIDKSLLSMLSLIVAAVGAGSSIAVLIACLLAGLLSVTNAIQSKNIKYMYLQWLSLLPGIAHMLIYVGYMIGGRF